MHGIFGLPGIICHVPIGTVTHCVEQLRGHSGPAALPGLQTVRYPEFAQCLTDLLQQEQLDACARLQMGSCQSQLKLQQQQDS